MSNLKYIKIYPFDQAPKRYREMSTNGGDEDWLALIPLAMYDSWDWTPVWLDCPAFGCCCVNEYRTKDYMILVGCHA